jgi:glycosyltransferase involved in cell wall biosynthesis
MFEDLANQFLADGHHVTIIFGDSALEESHSFTEKGRLILLGIKTADVKNISRAHRFMSELFLQRRMWSISQKYIPSTIHLIVTYSPSIFWAYIIKKIMKKYEAQSYLVLRDIFPKWAVDLKILSVFNPLYWFLKKVESDLYYVSTVIGVQSKKNLQYFQSTAELKNLPVELLYNWTQQEKKLSSCPADKFPSLRELLNLEDKIIFFYGGNLGIAQDLNYILNLVSELQDLNHVHFIFLGEGSEEKNIIKIKDDLKLSNVSILKALPRDQFDAAVLECDVGMISLSPKFQTHNIPGKLLAYLKSSKPVLASLNENNDLIDMINDGQFGCYSVGHDKETFLSNVRLLADDAKLRNQQGDNGKKFLERYFDVTNASQQIIKTINASKSI